MCSRVKILLFNLFLGEIGVDMLLLGKETAVLFLGLLSIIVGGLLAVVALLAFATDVSFTTIPLGLIPLPTFAAFWKWARFFEFLRLTNREFADRFPRYARV